MDCSIPPAVMPVTSEVEGLIPATRFATTRSIVGAAPDDAEAASAFWTPDADEEASADDA